MGCRSECQRGDEIRDLNCQIRGCGRRCGKRDREREGEGWRVGNNFLISRILIDNVAGRHGFVVRVGLGKKVHATLQVAKGRWAERVGARRFVVVFVQVFN